MPKGIYVRKTNPIANFGDKRGRPTTPLVDRFWSKVEKAGPIPSHMPDLGPCWVWTASTDRKGYGKLQIGTLAAPKFITAHRLAWELETGAKPTSNVLHRCDNPPCVRPSHLFEGTFGDNARDRMAKGRSASGGRHPFAKLTDEQAAEIRALDWSVMRPGAIAKRYGISYYSLHRLLRGETYKDS